jgi:hypothetical protein
VTQADFTGHAYRRYQEFRDGHNPESQYDGAAMSHTRLFEAAGIEVEAIQRCFVDAMAEFGDRQLGAGVADG